MRGAQVRCPSLTKSRLDRLKRAHAFWRLDRLARSLRNILPGIALIVGGRSPCAGGAGAGGAIVVALQRNAEAFVHCGLRGLRPGSCRRSEHGQRGGEGTDDGSSADDVFRPHGILLSRELAGTCWAHFIAEPGAHPAIMFDDNRVTTL